MARRLRAAAARTRLDRGSQRRDRVSLGGGTHERFAEIAAEFVRLKVDVIVTAGTASVVAAKQATSVIPIVFPVAGDPVGSGLVASLARPGGNVTGLSTQRPILLASDSNFCARLFPVSAGWRSLANVGNSRRRAGDERGSGGGPHARPRGCTLEIRRAEDIAPAFEALKGRADALYVVADPLVNDQPRSDQHLGAGRATADDFNAGTTSKRAV